MTWAQRLKRVFAIDIEKCKKCGGLPAHIKSSRSELQATRRNYDTFLKLKKGWLFVLTARAGLLDPTLQTRRSATPRDETSQTLMLALIFELLILIRATENHPL